MEEEYRILDDDDTRLLNEDFNTRVGKEKEGIGNIIRAFGEETKNSEGENSIDFCMRNGLEIMNGFFQHTKRKAEKKMERNRRTDTEQT